MLVLGIESSCDETAVALVRDGRQVLVNLVYSQVARHSPYGGVVPEIASRAHVEVLPSLLRDACARAGCGWSDIDAVAVTRGPGLATSLLVGTTAARALAVSLGVPLLGINHLEGHLYSVFLPPSSGGPFPSWPRPEDHCPLLVALVTGGHTLLAVVEKLGAYRIIGQTLDDAAGEALDKGSSLLGLGYPGGPAIEKAARDGRADAIPFPRGAAAASGERAGGFDRSFCFSYSGMKTALLYHLRARGAPPEGKDLADIAASYQEAVFGQLTARLGSALQAIQPKAFACVGGVARNQRLRALLEELAARYGIPFLVAPMEYCADNAAMIAGIAGARPMAAVHPSAMEIDPNLPVA